VHSDFHSRVAGSAEPCDSMFSNAISSIEHECASSFFVHSDNMPSATKTRGAFSGARPDRGAAKTVWGVLHAKASLIRHVANNSSEASSHGCLEVMQLVDSGASSGSESTRLDNCKAVDHGSGHQHADGNMSDPRGITGNGLCYVERERARYTYTHTTNFAYLSTTPITPIVTTDHPQDSSSKSL